MSGIKISSSYPTNNVYKKAGGASIKWVHVPDEANIDSNQYNWSIFYQDSWLWSDQCFRIGSDQGVCSDGRSDWYIKPNPDYTGSYRYMNDYDRVGNTGSSYNSERNEAKKWLWVSEDGSCFKCGTAPELLINRLPGYFGRGEPYESKWENIAINEYMLSDRRYDKLTGNFLFNLGDSIPILREITFVGYCFCLVSHGYQNNSYGTKAQKAQAWNFFGGGGPTSPTYVENGAGFIGNCQEFHLYRMACGTVDLSDAIITGSTVYAKDRRCVWQGEDNVYCRDLASSNYKTTYGLNVHFASYKGGSNKTNIQNMEVSVGDFSNNYRYRMVRRYDKINQNSIETSKQNLGEGSLTGGCKLCDTQNNSTMEATFNVAVENWDPVNIAKAVSKTDIKKIEVYFSGAAFNGYTGASVPELILISGAATISGNKVVVDSANFNSDIKIKIKNNANKLVAKLKFLKSDGTEVPADYGYYGKFGCELSDQIVE